MSHGLNPPQYRAVHTLSGPLLVLAGAGSGKTRVVTFRIAKLIENGIEPNRILGVTFTNKAANEMKERIRELLGKNLEKEPHISTFHSYCVGVLRRQIHHLGYPKSFSIYDRGDQEAVARKALRELRAPTTVLRPSDLLFHIGNWKNQGQSPTQAARIASTDKQHLAAAAYRRYQAELERAGVVDFDDLLLLTGRLFRDFREVRREEASRYDHLLVDEYQDTNGTQYDLIRALAQQHRNLCVVGDDDQSIYAWRGAEVEHILNFSKDWPKAKVVQLVDNYRCTEEILRLANQLIAVNTKRHPKELIAARKGGVRPAIRQFEDETTEAKLTVKDITQRLTQPNVQPRDFAILFRTNEQPRPFETELRAAKVPYVLIGGMSFFDRKEVKDILSYVQLLVDPTNEVALRRIINIPARGIGQRSIEVMLERAVELGEPLWTVLTKKLMHDRLPTAARKGIDELVDLIHQFRRPSKKPLHEQLQSLIARIDYQAELAREYEKEEDRETRWQAIEQVVNALAELEKTKKDISWRKFLDSTLLGEADSDDKDNQLKKNAVALMTLHSAKGLEFREVYLVGLEEGILPHHRSLTDDQDDVSEERRLCYVGITRAQDRLTVSLSLTRLKWGKPRETLPSRFLYEATNMMEHPNYFRALAGEKALKAAEAQKKRPKRKKKSVRRKGARRRS